MLAAQATIGNLYFENVDGHLQFFLFTKEWLTFARKNTSYTKNTISQVFLRTFLGKKRNIIFKIKLMKNYLKNLFKNNKIK